MAPIANNGSQFIYKRVVRPFVLKHQKQVDEALDKFQGMAADAINEVMKRTQKVAGEAEVAAREAAADAASKAAADAVNAGLDDKKVN
ncbi:receptor expression-enhancing protein 5-like [Saccoglossus kowalevskii]